MWKLFLQSHENKFDETQKNFIHKFCREFEGPTSSSQRTQFSRSRAKSTALRQKQKQKTKKKVKRINLKIYF